MIVAVVLIVAALVFYLVSTILALQKITKGLDQAIAGVVGIIEKSAPVNEVVTTINQNLDAGVDLLEGLLVKKAGMEDAVGLVEGLYPGSAAEGLPELPGQQDHQGPAHQRGLHEGHPDPGPAGPRGADRGGQPERAGAAQPGVRQPGRPRPLPGGPPDTAESMPRSPVIGTDSPVQYEPSDSPGVRKRMPVAVSASTPPPGTETGEPAEGGLAKSGLAFLRRFKKDD